MLPPSNFVTRPGRTGMMMLKPSTIRTRVTKMKPRAGLRGVVGSIPPILQGGRPFGKPKPGSILEFLLQKVHLEPELRARLDLEDLRGALGRGARLALHLQLGE